MKIIPKLGKQIDFIKNKFTMQKIQLILISVLLFSCANNRNQSTEKSEETAVIAVEEELTNVYDIDICDNIEEKNEIPPPPPPPIPQPTRGLRFLDLEGNELYMTDEYGNIIDRHGNIYPRSGNVVMIEQDGSVVVICRQDIVVRESDGNVVDRDGNVVAKNANIIVRNGDIIVGDRRLFNNVPNIVFTDQNGDIVVRNVNGDIIVRERDGNVIDKEGNIVVEDGFLVVEENGDILIKNADGDVFIRTRTIHGLVTQMKRIKQDK